MNPVDRPAPAPRRPPSNRRIITRVATAGLAVAGLAGLVACSSNSSSLPAALTGTTTAASVASTSPTPTASPSTSSPPVLASTVAVPAIDYGQQFLADVAPWNAALAAAGRSGLTSPAAVAAGRQAVATAGRLLSQSWPAVDAGDVHALALQFDTINEDIVADNQSKYLNDATTLNADANVVRAEFGLPAIK